MGSRCLGSSGPALRVSGPFPFAAPSLLCSTPFPATAPIPSGGWLCRTRCPPWCRRRPSRSRLFVTPKVTGGWRPVIDLSHLNGWVKLSHFHMETAQSVLQSLRPGDWMVSLDLQDAYLQVPVHPASRRYLRFCVWDAVYQFRALCFGLSTAPQAFTCVMAPVSSIMHRHGFRLLRYLDDWLVLGFTFQELVRARDFLLWLCHRLGIIANPSKSSLVPTQTLDYLGMTLASSPLRVFPTLKRVQKLSLLLQEFHSDRLRPVSVWRRLLGVMSSLSAIIPGACLRM